jgi:hypothetical protein
MPRHRCIRFEFGEVRTLNSGEEYLHIDGWYWDYNRHLGKAKTALSIFKFRVRKSGTQEITFNTTNLPKYSLGAINRQLSHSSLLVDNPWYRVRCSTFAR